MADLPLVDVPLSRWAEAGIEFEDEVVAYLSDSLGEIGDALRSLRHADAIAATSEAMDSGVPVIIGGALPDDIPGRKRGRPDLLTLTGIGADGVSKYLPADIKSHQVLRATKTGTIDSVALDQLTAADAWCTKVGLTPSSTHRLAGLMQLAHYWRLLEACGHESELGPLGESSAVTRSRPTSPSSCGSRSPSLTS